MRSSTGPRTEPQGSPDSIKKEEAFTGCQRPDKLH